ncbi:hypothetical protein G7047_19065 [Diaphorobacter sp. HDW4A]|uniref:phage tail terminator protein n=1 Tax=Diaphorobacter sp. HDW4A TaxID=2714924 RepID=UPI00140C7166|nr:hypothetical protein [Diaphorobacter sp. HDW4A]QIL81781.1 hypothetical protein G7047_19065 [Diaphorobacter sp. HDW4A]
MNFEPFDTGLIVQRLKLCVPDFQTVGGAADYAAVKELTNFRTPSAYVVFAEETNTNKIPASVGVCAQEAAVQFGVVLALRNYREQLGEQMADEARTLVGMVRAALIGFRPKLRGANTVGWVSGHVLDYNSSVMLFGDMYRLVYMLHKDDPCAPGACNGAV